MNFWYYKDSPVSSIEDLPNHEVLIGFCYRITNLQTGAIYIGKKNFSSTRKKKLAKRDLSAVTKESDWRDYYGSSKQIQEDVAKLGESSFHREIIALACSKKHLSYLELKHQFINDVLSINSYNGNILGRFYPRDLHPCTT
jgi:hypothetical protein